MKNLFLGLALASMTIACAAEQKTSVDDASAPGVECTQSCTMPESECATKCSEKEATECNKSGEVKVCPMTGKPIN